MTLKKIQLFTCLILCSSICFGQIVKDTTTCLVTIQQLRISNLAFNELDKMNEVVRQQDSLIYTQMKHVDIVTWQRNKFRERLEKSELEKIELEKKLKQAKTNVKNYSIAAFLLGAITTIILLY